MNRIEIILSSLALLSLSVDLLGAPFGDALLVVSFSALAVFYMYFAFPVFNQLPLKFAFSKRSKQNVPEISRLASRLFGFAIALIVIGFQFKLLQWPNANMMLIVGVAGLVVGEIQVYAKFRKSNSTLYLIALKRIAIFAIIGMVFLTA